MNSKLPKTGTDWIEASRLRKLSESFIRESEEFVAWHYISIYQKLSESFIREFSAKVDWRWISAFQKLSEDFIREFKDKVDWKQISKYQRLSESFIREFENEVHWVNIFIYQKLSKEFIEEFKLKLRPDNWIGEFDIAFADDNWHYKSTEYKQQKIDETGLYEIKDGYVYAYKKVRSDFWSLYNFQLQYLPGTIVEDFHYDPNCSEENSFGISLWTKEKALEYCSKGKLVYCRAKIEDVYALVHEGNKLRCSKIEVLSEINDE